ncbi:MAG: Maf family protein [Thioalkalivibrionaceae bacterium]
MTHRDTRDLRDPELGRATVHPPLILASTSRWRAELLAKLGVPFETRAPIGADETPRPGERVDHMVERLAVVKARAVQAAGAIPSNALIVGSDQSAEVDGEILRKPGNAARAHQQLRILSGRRVCFHTGLALLDVSNDHIRSTVETYTVCFRKLSDDLITRYVATESPFDSVGAFRSEGHGIVLFDALIGNDPNTLVGLPLIRLAQWLESARVSLLQTRPLGDHSGS